MPHPTRTRKSALQVVTARWTDPEWLRDRLTDEESEVVAATMREYQRRLRKAEPSAVMRLEGIVILYALARRAGLKALAASLDPPPGDDRKPSDGEEVGKAQERLRKALKEFEDALGGTPDAGAAGIADLLRPLLKETEGIVEEVVAAGNGRCSAAGHGK